MALKLPLAVVIEAIDKFTGPMRKVQHTLQKTFEPVGQLKNSLAGLGEAAGLPAAGKALGNFKTKISEVFGGLVALGRKVAFIGIAAAGAVIGLEESFARSGESIKKAAAKLGIGTDAVQELNYAAGQYGMEQGELEQGLLKMSKGLGEAAKGGGTLMAAFANLRIPLRDDNGHLRKLDDLLPEVADKMNDLADDGRRTALTVAIFGKSGAKLTPLLRHGGEMMKFMRNQARLLGGVMSEESVEAAEKFEQAQRRAEFALKGLRDTAGAELAPALTKLADQLAAFFADPKTKKALQDLVQDFAKNLPKAVDKAVEAIKQIAAVLEPFARVVQFLGEHFGYGNVAIALMATYLGAKLLPALAALIPVVTALIPLMTALDVALDANPIGLIALAIAGAIIQMAAMAAAGIWLIKHWEKVRDFFVELWDLTKRGFHEWADVIGRAVDKVTGILPDWLTGKSTAISVNAATPIGINAAGGRGGAPEARVVVQFKDAPKGTRLVPQGNSGVDLDTSMGYSMVPFGG